jgi:GNAT superfamily N-acetyltransferase
MPEFMGPWNPLDDLPEAFVALPAQIYADDPFWLGEDAAALRGQFSPDNTWFAQGAAWLGVIPGQARLAGFCQDQVVDGERVAFFGFWESVNDSAPNRRLFAALADWARALGATRLYGPINFSTFGAYRLRLDAFERGAFPGEPWNPPYYEDLLAQLGFEQRYRYLSTFNATAEVVSAVAPDYLRVKPQLEERVELVAMTPDFWRDNLDTLYGFVDEVFGANFAYTAISREAFHAQCGAPFAERFCPRTSILARQRGSGRIAGFFLVYPDYGPLLRQGAGAQRIAAARYATHFEQLPAPRRALARTGGVHPDFRALGLFTAMGCELSLRADGLYDTLAAPLVREDNNSRQFALRHGRAHRHHYGLFQGAL